MALMGYSQSWPMWLLTGVPLMWWLAAKHRTGLSRRRVIIAAGLRSGALVLASFALTGPSLNTVHHEVSVVYALDISRSVSPRFLKSALNWINDADSRYQPAQSRYVVFADRARLVATVGAIASVEVVPEIEYGQRSNDSARGDGIDQSATNIENGLIASLFGFAPSAAKRLVLFTDGNQTQGDLWRVMPRLLSEKVRVFTVPATVTVDNDAWIESVSVPEGVRQHEPTEVTVRVVSRAPCRARIEMKIGGELLGTKTTTLSPGENELTIPVRFRSPGANAVAVQVFADGDQFAANDVLSEAIWIEPPPKILYVEADSQRAIYLADALKRQGIDVSVATVWEFVKDPALLEGKDGVILSDIRARDVDSSTALRLETFVRETGGGLIFAAGENTYGRDGFSKSALERLLPVRFEGKRKKLELDLVLLIDRSHSMRGHKLELAKSAALGTLDLLDRDHRLAVVAFDSNAHDVVPLAKVGTKRRAEDLIRGMTSSGQTNLFNGLWHAQHLLDGSEATTKHIILLSDGNTAPPPGNALKSSSEQAMEIIRKVREDAMRRANAPLKADVAVEPPLGDYPEILEKLVAAKISLTTVAIGDKPNVGLMANLAVGAEGKSYVAEHDSEIPGLFVSETRRLLGQSIVEHPFRPIVKGRVPAIDGVDFSSGPPLKGFVVSRPKKFSDVVLEARKDQPLLAETRYGLGKTIAFMSDVKNRWAADWIDWPGYGQLWGQIVRDSARRDVGTGLTWRVTRVGDEAVCTLLIFRSDGTFHNGLSPAFRIIAPDGESSVARLRQVAPGRYEARVALATSRAAPYRFELIEGPGISKWDVTRSGVRSVGYSFTDEFRLQAADLELLTAVSEQTGGKFAPRAGDIFADLGDRLIAKIPLWQYLTAGALLLFLLELAVRRAPGRAGPAALR